MCAEKKVQREDLQFHVQYVLLVCGADVTEPPPPLEQNKNNRMIKYVASLPLESIVDVKGVLVEANVKSCTQVRGPRIPSSDRLSSVLGVVLFLRRPLRMAAVVLLRCALALP